MKPRLSLIGATFHERPVRLRLPFRFGAATLREAPQVFVHARVRFADGREGFGIAAELLAPKWFDKSPELSNEQNFDQLRRSLTIALRHYLDAGTETAFGLSAAVETAHHAACAAERLNGLIASFGMALIDRAIIDALGRLEDQSVFSLVRKNLIGLTAATAADLGGFDLEKFLAGLQPASHIHARHTVGLVDALTRDETRGQRLDDGLPESLEEAIATYGHRYFKLKVCGDIDTDIDRLKRIAAVLEQSAGPYQATLDGNEQYDEIGAVVALWQRIAAEPQLKRLRASLILVEQPIARAKALEQPVHKLAQHVTMEIDESDADIGAFVRARRLGYRGISSKSCKGFYRALINRARVEQWNAEGFERYAMSAEDLTTQGGIAVQQDLALATLIGATHVERNGHHYVDGMAGAPDAEQEAFLAAHPDLYHRADNGRARLTIRDGVIMMHSLETPGLGSAVIPDAGAMQPSLS